MKKQGDPRQSAPMSPGQAIADLAASLTMMSDPRFKRFYNYCPAPAVIPWFRKTKPVNFLVGANKAMKTTIGIFKCIMVYTGIVPPALRSCYPVEIPVNRPRHVRIIVQNYSKHWPETIRPLLMDDDEYGMLPKVWSQYDNAEHMFYGPDGSWLSIMAVDPSQKTDPYDLRGPLVDHTYIDEETTEVAYKESLTRNATLNDGPQSVDLGWCPQSGNDHWQVKDLYALAYDLKSHERLADEQQSPFHNGLRLSMKDNPSITPEKVAQFVSTLKTWEYNYRVLGIPSARAEDPFFQLAILDKWDREKRCTPGERCRLVQLEVDREEGIFRGMLVPEKFADADAPLWEVWEWPIAGEKYIGTMDSGEGIRTGDFHAIDFWRCTEKGVACPPVQCAQLHTRSIGPDIAAIEALCVCGLFGECLFAWENNNTSGGVVTEVARNYQNNYTRGARDRSELPEEDTLLGWHTNPFNKPAALTETYRMVDQWENRYGGICGIRSQTTLNEMMKYEDRIEKNKNGDTMRILGAGKGAHDDTVTALYVMVYISRLQSDLLTVCTVSVTPSRNSYDSLLERHASEVDATATGRFAKMKPQPSIKQLAHKPQARPEPPGRRTFRSIYGSTR